MHPILIELSGFSIKTYGFLIALGFAIRLFLASREARRVGLNVQTIGDLAFYILLGAIVGARLYFILTNLSYSHSIRLTCLKSGRAA